jgi:tRNA(His) 5'-end guanylyltransferase
MSAMDRSAMDLCGMFQGCKMAYVQSDEASFLLTDYDRLETEAFFDYEVQKISSVVASMMTSVFTRRIIDALMLNSGVWPMFDARCFNVPREEVTNYFLWRAKDWERNSLSMYCGSFFSDKELHGKGRSDKHEMLNGIGKNWTADLSPRQRNGAFIVRGVGGGYVETSDILAKYVDIHSLVAPFVSTDVDDVL